MFLLPLFYVSQNRIIKNVHQYARYSIKKKHSFPAWWNKEINISSPQTVRIKLVKTVQNYDFSTLKINPKYTTNRIICSWKHWTLGTNGMSLAQECPHCAPPTPTQLQFCCSTRQFSQGGALPEGALLTGALSAYMAILGAWEQGGQWLHFPVFTVLFEQLTG